MNKKKRKISLVLVTLVFLLGLSACTKKEAKEENTNEKKQEEVEEKEETEEVEEKDIAIGMTFDEAKEIEKDKELVNEITGDEGNFLIYDIEFAEQMASLQLYFIEVEDELVIDEILYVFDASETIQEGAENTKKTLDALMDKYGKPSMIETDQEGVEISEDNYHEFLTEAGEIIFAWTKNNEYIQFTIGQMDNSVAQTIYIVEE